MSISVGSRCIGGARGTSGFCRASAWAIGAALAMVWNCALAEGDFPIEGTFTQNEVCRGDGSKQQFALVKVTPQDVSYSGGVCTIDSRQLSGNNLSMRLTCKFTSGKVLSSGVTFTKKDDNTLDMAQQEGTYRAVLHRCPG
jgi:hypothetical protein